MFFCFDAETDGLYGQAFAIGVVVMDSAGRTLDQFSGQASVESVQTPWVRENVLPKLSDLPEYGTCHELREAFWSFWLKHRNTSVCLADVPYPVEAQLMRQCVEADLHNRQWLGPYPLIDVASALALAGLDPLTDRQLYSGFCGREHHPVDDAIASCLSYLKVIQMIQSNQQG